MTKKKSKAPLEPEKISNLSSVQEPPAALTPIVKEKRAKSTKTKSTETSVPTLVISRNKHWRYISSYHGPWLQLPPEVLESLAYSNFYSPRPQPIDPAVFFDLVKIRRLVEDATSLAVRAANGTTSASLSTSLNAGNGILNGSEAEILGIGVTRGGGHAKLSRERKHRMREHATQKLSHAYHLDEIAASVATMQSASPLEDVAKLVLQRNENDPDAQYVHFFHEKIPSRAMAHYTSLDPLNEVINQRPTDGAPYRTRAVARFFKSDFGGAARDLTDGLAVSRLYTSQHKNEQRELILARDAAKLAREYRMDAKVDEKDHPSSLEPQLLFHRGGAYLTLACDQIEPALREYKQRNPPGRESVNGLDDLPPLTTAEREQQKTQVEARKLVRGYAKRALRDYVAFLSHFDYTPGIPAEFTETFLQKVNAYSTRSSNRSRSEKLLDVDAHSLHGNSDALIRYEGQRDGATAQHLPAIPKPEVYHLNALFAAVPPADLPAYPPDPDTAKAKTNPIFSLPDFSEAVTYHPLLTDVLHSLLLCHCLIQTSVKEHLRHAYMAARIARVCDGYPIFLAARSPARADWIEVIRRSRNWLGLEASWESLCAPAPLPGHQNNSSKAKKPETPEERRERTKREAIRDALADERVFDEESFRASVRARELRAAREEEEEQRKEYLRTSATSSSSDSTKNAGPNGASNHTSTANGISPTTTTPRRWAQDDGKEYPITTERADAIARWIRQAPLPGSNHSSDPSTSTTAANGAAGGGGGSSGGRSKKSARSNAAATAAAQAGRLTKAASDLSTISVATRAHSKDNENENHVVSNGLETSVESLEID